MEKKNTVLLTVIAVATLLVVVVGATFAYFTAQVTTTNPDAKTTTGKTAAIAGATMTLGDYVGEENMYPGLTVVKPITVSGTCSEGATCDPVKANIKITASIDNKFGTDVEWTLYKSPDAPVYCKNDITKDDQLNKFYMTSVCKGVPTDDTNWGLTDTIDFTATDWTNKVLKSGNKTGITTQEISVAGDTDSETYYLVINYKNNGNQNTQQGKEFAITVEFEPISLGSAG